MPDLEEFRKEWEEKGMPLEGLQALESKIEYNEKEGTWKWDIPQEKTKVFDIQLLKRKWELSLPRFTVELQEAGSPPRVVVIVSFKDEEGIWRYKEHTVLDKWDIVIPNLIFLGLKDWERDDQGLPPIDPFENDLENS